MDYTDNIQYSVHAYFDSGYYTGIRVVFVDRVAVVILAQLTTHHTHLNFYWSLVYSTTNCWVIALACFQRHQRTPSIESTYLQVCTWDEWCCTLTSSASHRPSAYSEAISTTLSSANLLTGLRRKEVCFPRRTCPYFKTWTPSVWTQPQRQSKLCLHPLLSQRI